MKVKVSAKVACKIRTTWLVLSRHLEAATCPFTEKRLPSLSGLAGAEVRLPNLLICRHAFVSPGPKDSSGQSLFRLRRRAYEMVVAFNSVQTLLWRIRAILGPCNITSR
jgi:hypothetical protein